MSILDPAAPIRRRIFAAIGICTALAMAGLFIWGRFGWDRADHWQRQFRTRDAQAATVLIALRDASGNPKLKWSGAAGQVIALGISKRDLERSIEEQNRSIRDMASEAVRLKARAAELKEIADKAEAQREAALTKLSDLSITPGTREDCMTLLKEAEEALDLVYEAGL